MSTTALPISTLYGQRVEGTTAPVQWNFDTVNRLFAAVHDRDLYEDDEEPTPRTETLVHAVLLVGELDPRFQRNFEILPYWGQLNMTWRSGRDRRVKATVAADGGLIIYHEQMFEDRVVDSGLDRRGSLDLLRNRLAWLYT